MGKIESSKSWLLLPIIRGIVCVPLALISACDKSNSILCFFSFSSLFVFVFHLVLHWEIILDTLFLCCFFSSTFATSHLMLPFSGQAFAIPYCKLTVLIPPVSKRPKSTRGCLNECFNSREKSIACTSFATGMKEFSQHKSLLF